MPMQIAEHNEAIYHAQIKDSIRLDNIPPTFLQVFDPRIKQKLLGVFNH